MFLSEQTSLKRNLMPGGMGPVPLLLLSHKLK